MKMYMRLLLLIGCLLGSVARGQVPAPDTFFGHDLGSQFHRHHEVMAYVAAVAAASPRVQLQPYGQTYEGRELTLAFLSSERNLAQLETIRENNLRATGLLTGTIDGPRLPIVWLSYNIHGNESVSTEAAMQVLYQLVSQDTAQWLDDLIVVIDPCVNPDGRDRYVNWYQQVRHPQPVADPADLEHHEPWPGGRYNHYLFDLNRDWCWQTQQESQLRGAQYSRWLPQVHVDFHEMGPNSPYFFAPAARPFHPIITQWQREFQRLVGGNHAQAFDRAGWAYFTSEVYDLFYPSYGDTWPTYQGAIGFTYEQGGSGRAGLAYQVPTGDTLTLRDRIDHHYTTSLSTVATAHQQRERLLASFDQYFADARQGKDATYTAYHVSQANAAGKLTDLLDLLDRQQIRYQQASRDSRVRGYSYQANAEQSATIEAGDLILPVQQPQGHLLRVLFDPQAPLEDSLTYDLTAWALPYAYGLTAHALVESVPTEPYEASPFAPHRAPEAPAYAYLVAWEDLRAVRWLADMQAAGVVLRRSQGRLTVQGQTFAPGALVAMRADNPHQDLDGLAVRLANAHQVELTAVLTGRMMQGPDLGSDAYAVLPPVQVGLLRGPETSATRLGELWFCLEQEMGLPVHLLGTDYLDRVELAAYDVLILPEGRYQAFREQLIDYVRQGGRIVAIEGAIATFARNQTTLAASLQAQANETDNPPPSAKDDTWLQAYGERSQRYASGSVPGTIFRVQLDASHPLAYGLGEQYFALKHQRDTYPYLRGGWNVGTYPSGKPVSGFAGYQAQQAIAQSLAIGTESLGQGELVYLVDSPCFRAFWQGGKLLLANAIWLAE